MDQPEDGRPPRGRLARMARLAALPAAHAGRTAVGLGRRIGGRPAEVVAAQVQQRTAEQLFATLGQLEGGAMKVGQAMSAMEAALPEQLVGPYRDALVRLQEAAPAMPAPMVHEQLVRAFGTSWRQVLEDFDDRPVAAASVGQVHRATWSDGTPVAVKVQYPGAGETLVADLGMLEKLAPVVSAAAPGLDARQLLAELRARLVEELDHVREAAAQTAFADAYRGDPDIPVPDVLAAEDRVLVTRWVGGTPLSRVIATGTRADRDRAGQLLLRLLASASVRARRPAPRQLLAAARRPARRPRLRRDRGPAARLAGPARPAARRRPGRRRLGPAPDRRLRRTAAPGPGHRRRPARPARPLPAAAAHPGPPVHPGLAAGADPARLRPVRRGRAHPAPADRPAAPPAAAARGQRTGRRPLLPRRHRRRRRRGPALVARPRPDSTVPTPTVSRCADR